MATSYGQYSVLIDLRPGVIAATLRTTLFALYNASSNTCFIRDIFINYSFRLTNSVATSAHITMARFSGTIPSGGNSTTPAKFKTTHPTSVVTVNQIASGALVGLTMTGATFSPAHFSLGSQRNGGARGATLEVSRSITDAFEIAPLEGLAIMMPVNSSILGDEFTGRIQWDER